MDYKGLTADMVAEIEAHRAMVDCESTRDFLTHIDSWFVTCGNHPRVFGDPMEPIINGW